MRKLKKNKILILTLILMLCGHFSTTFAQNKKKTKKSIAVQNLASSSTPPEIGLKISNLIEKTIFKSRNFFLKEPNPSDKVLNSLKRKYQQDKNSNSLNYAVKIGEILSVDYVFIGETIKNGEQLEFNVKIVNVKEKKVLLMDSLKLKDKSEINEEIPEFTDEIISRIKKAETRGQYKYIFSSRVQYLTPTGQLADRVENGVGLLLAGSIENIFFNNFQLGVNLEYLSFNGKSNITHHAILMPFSILTAYSFKLYDFEFIPSLSAGISYNRLYPYRSYSSKEYEEKKNKKPFVKAEGVVNYILNDTFSLQLGYSYGTIFESEGRISYTSLQAGVSAVF